MPLENSVVLQGVQDQLFGNSSRDSILLGLPDELKRMFSPTHPVTIVDVSSAGPRTLSSGFHSSPASTL